MKLEIVNMFFIFLLFLSVPLIVYGQEVYQNYYEDSQIYDHNITNDDMTLSIDSLIYQPGDLATIFGFVNEKHSGYKVIIHVIDTMGISRSEIFVTVNNEGIFKVQNTIPHDIPSGIYTILAKYGEFGIPLSLEITIPDTTTGTSISIPFESSKSTSGMTFTPEVVSIKEDLPLTWNNNDETVHTVVSIKKGITNKSFPDGVFASGIFGPGDSFEITLKEGEYDYFCKLHPWLLGKIIVTQSVSVPIVTENNYSQIDLNDKDIVIQKDRNGIYQKGDLVKITGKVKILEPGAVTIKILDPDSNVVSIKQITPDLENNSFVFDFLLDDKNFDKDGIYQVVAQFGVRENQSRVLIQLAIPKLVEKNYLGFDIYQAGGSFYGILHGEKFDLSKIETSDFLISGVTSKAIYDLADKHPPLGPFTIEENYNGFDLILYQGTFYAIPSDNLELADDIKLGLFDQTIPTGTEPFAITFDIHTNYIFVTNFESDNLTIINGINNHLVKHLPLGDGPRGMDINPITKKLYVANFHDQTLSIIDIETLKIDSTIQLPGSPFEVSVNKITNTIFVTNGDSTVSIINGDTNTIDTNVELEGRPYGVDVNETLDLTYVSREPNHVDAIFGKKVVSSISVGSKPIDVIVNNDLNFLYTANFNSNNISIVNSLNNEVIDIVDVGMHPRDLAFNENNTKLYVANYGSSSISVLDIPKNVIRSTIPVGESISGIINNQNIEHLYILSRPNLIYMLNEATDTIVRIPNASSLDGIKKIVNDIILKFSQISSVENNIRSSFPVSNEILLDIWSEREDLQKEFEDIQFGNLDGLRTWAEVEGWKEDPRLSSLIPDGMIPNYESIVPDDKIVDDANSFDNLGYVVLIILPIAGIIIFVIFKYTKKE